jgi:GTP1/Obg family GTP-binding protein
MSEPASIDNNAIEQQAIEALAYLDDESKRKVLNYIDSLVTLDKVNNGSGSS